MSGADAGGGGPGGPFGGPPNFIKRKKNDARVHVKTTHYST